MKKHEMHRERLLELVASTPDQRMRPSELTRGLAQEVGLSAHAVKQIINELVEDMELVYAYRDPCSYVEIPCNGCDGGHRAARPMKVVMDSEGTPWLCDKEFDEAEALLAEDCWNCGDLPFTRT
jgi:hypothetical protein